MFEYLIIVLLAVNFIVSCLIVNVMYNSLKQSRWDSNFIASIFDSLDFFVKEYKEVNKEELSIDDSIFEVGVNPEVAEREREFDNRIEYLKLELERNRDLLEGQMNMFDEGTVADILHKGVYNIPHNEVELYNEEIEVAD